MTGMLNSSAAQAVSATLLYPGILSRRRGQPVAAQTIVVKTKRHRLSENENENIGSAMLESNSGNESRNMANLTDSITLATIVRILEVLMAITTLMRTSEGTIMMSNRWKQL